MAGNTLARELSESAGVRFAVAAEADEGAIRQLLRENPMEGAIRLTFEREPHYFHGANLAGADDETIVAYEGGRLLCMGRSTRRECWVNGRPTSTGYLAELRLDAAVRGRFRIVRDGYRYFLQRHAEDSAKLYFTSVAADNERARRFLERGARGMPTYTFLAELNTLLIPVRREGRPTGLKIQRATLDCVPEIARLLNTSARRDQLAAVWSEENLRSLVRHGAGIDRFLLAREGGALVAAGFMWDQRSFRQTVIRGYAASLSLARPFLNAVAPWLGTTKLPKTGAVLPSAFLGPCRFAEGAEELLPDFIEAFFPLARESSVEWLTLALPDGDPRLSRLRRRFSPRVYRSRLYRVDAPDENRFASFDEGSTFLPDVALL